ncbi:MAG: hypothetical protein ACRYFW_05075 [Janthinobacterium lividum]
MSALYHGFDDLLDRLLPPDNWNNPVDKSRPKSEDWLAAPAAMSANRSV